MNKDSYFSSSEQRCFAIEELKKLIKTETDSNTIHAYKIALVNLGSNNLLEREDEIGYGYRKIAGDIDNLYDKLDYTLKAYDRLNKKIIGLQIISIVAYVITLVILLFK